MADQARAATTAVAAAPPAAPAPFVHPASGEVIPADAPTSDLAAQLYETRELEARLRTFKARVGREVIRRMDAEARWSADVGRWKIAAPSPTAGTRYDGELLERVLGELVEVGAITIEAHRAAVHPETLWKVKADGLRRLRALGNADVDAAIDRASIPPDPDARRPAVTLRREDA